MCSLCTAGEKIAASQPLNGDASVINYRHAEVGHKETLM